MARTTNTSKSSSRATGSTAPTTVTQDDHNLKDALIGTDERGITSNISWGSIFAGVATFLALSILLGLVTAALGLSGASGTATGIWSVIALAIALAAAGYVAGALAVRGGLLHGFLTWAASLLSLLLLVGWLGSSILGVVGGTLSTVAEAANVSQSDVESATDSVSSSDVDAAKDQASDAADQVQQVATENKDEAAKGAWWSVAGLGIGALLASFAGAAGAKNTHTRREVVRTPERV